ncbi:protein of unknown function [Acidithiobacillus ferrivorans]|uniref:Uncharacterized protein n=1 Tax=Acidithiobacillus ferrivorans TaxID=160808 RepID=A0ABY1MPG7_9PROT|nr:protein of unknown function [Acidithiobacillus ferrivorans]
MILLAWLSTSFAKLAHDVTHKIWLTPTETGLYLVLGRSAIRLARRPGVSLDYAASLFAFTIAPII